MTKTERLAIKILQSDKAALERVAVQEGEPVAVVVRRIIRADLLRRGLLPVTAGGLVLPDPSGPSGKECVA